MSASRSYNFAKLIGASVMSHIREAEMYLTPQKIVYHLPWAFHGEEVVKVTRISRDEKGLWIEATLPPRKAGEKLTDLFEEEL